MKKNLILGFLLLLLACGWLWADTVGAFIFIVSANPTSCTAGQFFWNTTTNQLLVCPALNTVAAVSPLKGTTGTITGTLQIVGGCNSGTVSVAGSLHGQPVTVSPTDGSFVGGSFTLRGDVTSDGTVTVNICAVVAGTPPSKAYNVSVGP